MKTIRFERQGSIGHIVLANPPYNRLDLQFSHCLRDAVHEASSSDIRALVISSEGGTSALAAKCASGQARTSIGSAPSLLR
jgi:enoyl-CoA hydratase/carnithine racemase